MKNKVFTFLLIVLGFVGFQACISSTKNHEIDARISLITQLEKKYPENRPVNIVFHGHSVPLGVFISPEVRTFESYPYLFLKDLKALYPNVAVNIILTCHEGENSEGGLKRFKIEVLNHTPDIIFIDYALNDIGMSVAQSKNNHLTMIRFAKERHIPIVLITPSPDLRLDLKNKGNLLNLLRNMLIELGKEQQIPVIDSYNTFEPYILNDSIEYVMSTVNHPNLKGHELIEKEIIYWVFGHASSEIIN